MSLRSGLRLIGSLVGAAGVAFSLTLLSRSMRSVQSIGGYCASGGPYQIAHHCPKGTAGVFILAIFGGLLFLGLFAAFTTETGRILALLAWPALFFSLGWNFLDYGLHVTITGSGVNAGFLVSAVVFIVMGAVPLIWLLPRLWRIVTGAPDPETLAPRPSPMSWATSPLVNPPASSPPTSSAAPSWGTSAPLNPAPTATTTTTVKPTKDIAGELERLASLHRRGDLTDAEYEAAKQQAITSSGTPT
jgi:hypothetical protein